MPPVHLIKLSAWSKHDLFMLTYTMPRLGALGSNQQKLIGVLVLMNGDDVYNFMSKALEVNKSIGISDMQPSPNALISQIVNELSKNTEHCVAISDINSVYFPRASAYHQCPVHQTRCHCHPIYAGDDGCTKQCYDCRCRIDHSLLPK